MKRERCKSCGKRIRGPHHQDEEGNCRNRLIAVSSIKKRRK